MYVETEQLLKSVANTVMPTVDAGDVYEPTVGQTWVRATFMPGQSSTMSLGPDHIDEYTGLYRLDIFVTKGTSLPAINKLVDQFIQAYKSTQVIQPEDYNRFDENVVVHINNAWREAARFEPVWVNIPVYVSWRVMFTHTKA